MRDETTEISRTPSLGEKALPKAPTGIRGLDEVTGGGLPRGRPTLVCGPAGCGKTLLGIEFLVRGITESGESGVFLAFEETRLDLIANVASLGFDLEQLEADNRLVLDSVTIDRTEILQSGDWDLDGLFIRLAAAIDAVGAQRVVIDTLENLFGVFEDQVTLRFELRRLFSWLKERGVTTIVTGERGDGTLTRHGIEEYVSDCVIVLDHRVIEQTSTRRLRVLKYRGSVHGTNEYPFLIGRHGLSVLPITSLSLDHQVYDERVSIGVPRIDTMLGEGVYRGSSVLVSGTAGTGKSTVAAQFCDAACARGERALLFAFEESQNQIIRNMATVGMDLHHWVEKGLLRFVCSRPSLLGLESHLTVMQDEVADFDPAVVVLDPISDLMSAGLQRDVLAMLTRQVDYLKVRGITGLFVTLNQETSVEAAQHQITSLIDVWIQLRMHEANSERTLSLSVVKARGTHHSNQVRELSIGAHGLQLADEHGLEPVLTGTPRRAAARQRHRAGRKGSDQWSALSETVGRRPVAAATEQSVEVEL